MDYLEREKTIKEAFQKEIRKTLELSTKDKQNLHIQCKLIDFIKNSGFEEIDINKTIFLTKKEAERNLKIK